MTSWLKPRQPQGPLPTLRVRSKRLKKSPRFRHAPKPICNNFSWMLEPYGAFDVAREFLEWGNSTTATGQSCTTCAVQAPNGAKSTTGCQRDLPKSDS